MPKFILTIICMFFVTGLYAQDKHTLSGIVYDKKNNETIIGATVVINKTTTTTNEYGFYSITLPKGSYQITVSYVGYNPETVLVNLENNTQKNIYLEENQQVLEEVVVKSNIEKTNIRKPEISLNKLSVATIKQMPVVLGEADIIKSILFLPGVTNAGEGQSGFNVRGGAVDQNLILLDEATIYNSSHLFGFFSVFNPDAVKDLRLYKGGIPARYGGRVSSVLDIYQKEGNNKEFHANGGIGLVASRLLAEGPIVKNKGSFLFGGRASYAHLFLKLSNNNNSAYFYDLNTKLNYKFNKNNSLYLSGYFGRDVFDIAQSFTNTYGNSILNLRWNHLFSDKLFSNLSLIYSDYYYGLTLDFVGFNWDSGIKNYNLKYDFKNYISDNLKLNFGANAIYYNFNPGTIEPSKEDSGINFKQLEKKYAFEPAAYLDFEQKISDKLNIEYGVRYSLFYRLGNSTVNLYQNDNPVVFDSELQLYEKATPTGTQHYGSNKVIASYNNLEPRFSMAYQLNDNQSIKAGYNRMAQYLQLISNTASPTPLDVWTPSDRYIKPQLCDQYAIGYFSNLKNDYSVEIESFFKTVKNRMDYIDGAELIANEAIEQVILNGKMRSYGLELMLKKNEGKLKGWISYTISRSEQKTPGRNAQETGINNGNWYKNAYDKLHNLAVTANYKFTNKWTFGANFVLQSGQPITYPNSQYVYQGITIPNYGLRNENRLPLYHHLDISATLTPQNQRTKKFKSEWVFSIYNLYNRKNAANISFRQNQDTGQNEAIRLSIFGMVPAVTYNFRF